MPLRNSSRESSGASASQAAIPAVLAAAGYNFSLLLRWLEALLRTLIAALSHRPTVPKTA